MSDPRPRRSRRAAGRPPEPQPAANAVEGGLEARATEGLRHSDTHGTCSSATGQIQHPAQAIKSASSTGASPGQLYASQQSPQPGTAQLAGQVPTRPLGGGPPTAPFMQTNSMMSNIHGAWQSRQDMPMAATGGSYSPGNWPQQQQAYGWGANAAACYGPGAMVYPPSGYPMWQGQAAAMQMQQPMPIQQLE